MNNRICGIGFAVAAACCLVAGTGCRTPGAKERADDAARTRDRLQQETREFLATNPAPLTLSKAVELARGRTLKLTQEELERDVARLAKSLTFSVFLPQVEVAFQRQGTDKPIYDKIGSMKLQMSDQYLSTASAQLTQPIFTPQAWLVFVETRQVARAMELRMERAREMLDVQVAALFYQAAVADASVKMYQAQLEASKTLADQIRSQADKGYALEADVERVKARVASDAFSLSRAKDTRALTRAKLCEVLRLWPLEEGVALNGPSMTEVLKRDWMLRDDEGKPVTKPAEEARQMTLDEMLWQTLVSRKELWIGDQMVQFRKTEVLQALAGFLPNFYGGFSGNWTTQSIQDPRKYWAGALEGSLSVFDGFKTVNEYRIARKFREAEYKLQEDRALALLTGVFEAYQNWRQSAERKQVADQVLKACELDYKTAQSRFRQDQETASQVLDKLADLENARLMHVSATYATALTEIVLRDAMGEPFGAPDAERAKAE
jgi:outer membrane protein TolC